MLTPFPDLLTFGFFAPTLLRFAAAFVFMYVAYMQLKHKDSLSHITMPLVGKSMWIVWVAIAVESITAAGLFFGYYAQCAAILGIAVAVKQIYWRNTYPTFFILPRTTSALLVVMLVSLLLTGAGALAFDLPL